VEYLVQRTPRVLIAGELSIRPIHFGNNSWPGRNLVLTGSQRNSIISERVPLKPRFRTKSAHQLSLSLRRFRNQRHNTTVPALDCKSELFLPLKFRIPISKSIKHSQQSHKHICAFSKYETHAWTGARPAPKRGVLPSWAHRRPTIRPERTSIAAPESLISPHCAVVDLYQIPFLHV
jgi:hypothetical protein